MDHQGRHIVIGTAGHIDHGKSALIKALTGTDPDRLPEEKERGMTIDLGFAFWGDNITFIDVPGHEKFVKNMLAGAATIDLVLLIIAADDGIMPQTIEHLEICKLLNIKKGLVVITKIDLVEKTWVEMVTNDVREFIQTSFLANTPIIPVSSITGEGIDEFRKELTRLVQEVQPKKDRGIFRLPIDRIFTMKGFGTVIAGTVLSGMARIGDQLEMLPQGKNVKIRGIQVHNKSVEVAQLGERVALNLHGIEKESISRGDVLAQPGYFKPTLLINANLLLLKDIEEPLRHMTRVRLHIGTSEIMCRVYLIDRKELIPGQSGFAQLRIEKPTVCDRNDRFVIRSYSPQKTIGGGIVLEPNPKRALRFSEELIERLSNLTSEKTEDIVAEIIRASISQPLSSEEISRRAGIALTTINPIIDDLLKNEQIVSLTFEARRSFYNKKNFQNHKVLLIKSIEEMLKKNPLKIDVKHSELKARFPQNMKLELFNIILRDLTQEGKIKFEGGTTITLPGFEIALNPSDKKICEEIEKLFKENLFAPPPLNDIIKAVRTNESRAKELVAFLISSNKLVNAGEGAVFHKDAISEAESVILNHFSQKNELRAADFKEKIKTTRKFAIPLLTYFDQKGLTLRRGDVRVLKPKK